jgi:hypothetical protein
VTASPAVAYLEDGEVSDAQEGDGERQAEASTIGSRRRHVGRCVAAPSLGVEHI